MTRLMTPFRKLVSSLMTSWDPKTAVVVADICEERELYQWADNLRFWVENKKEPQHMVISEMGRAFQIRYTKRILNKQHRDWLHPLEKQTIRKKKLCGLEWRGYSCSRRLNNPPPEFRGYEPLHRCLRVKDHKGNHDSRGEQHYQDEQIKVRARRARNQ